MGGNTGHRIANVVLRFLELCSAVIVVGIVGWAMHRIHNAGGHINGRLIYVEAIAAMSITLSLLLILPMDYVFKAWPLDLIL